MSSAFLTLYRSLTQHRLYGILNIGGLALGFALFLVLMLFVRFETYYDRVLPRWERVWTIERTIQFPVMRRLLVQFLKPVLLALVIAAATVASRASRGSTRAVGNMANVKRRA